MSDAKPLAWIGVFDGDPDPEFIWWDEAKARRWINTRPGVQLAPLFLAPTLTDAERALLVMLADHPNTHDLFPEDAQTIRGLLDRLSPITQAESDRPKPIATPPTQPTPGECSKPREGT